MLETARATYDPAHTAALFGLHDLALETVFYQRTPTEFGVRLWCFNPPHQHTIRSPERGTDRDALKVVDFYAPDFDEALARLQNAGHSPKSTIAEYELPEGKFREAHFWRPDNIVCAVISGHPEFFSKFVSTVDRAFSEPQSISAPVSDVDSVIDFYREAFGFTPLHRYQISNPTFDAMVGANQPLHLSAVNIGADLREPYLGVIDYGQADAEGESLAGRSRPPMRGLVGVELHVEDIDSTVSAADRTGACVLAGPTTLHYPPFGKVASCVIEGPHGVIHHVIQS